MVFWPTPRWHLQDGNGNVIDESAVIPPADSELALIGKGKPARVADSQVLNIHGSGDDSSLWGFDDKAERGFGHGRRSDVLHRSAHRALVTFYIVFGDLGER